MLEASKVPYSRLVADARPYASAPPRRLAVDGGTPAFSEPLHVGRPNVGSKERFLELAEQMFDRGWFTNDGPLVREFEQTVADYIGVRHCVAMSNGTVALEIAIRALGMTGEVIVPSFTFVATAHALYWQGITPVFADVDPVTHVLDPAAVRKAITPRTTGIIGVHLWGRPAPVEELQEIADEHGLTLMFDAAHAFGSSHNGSSIGGFGRAEVFSFHATKFFNSFEGGAVVTNDDALAGAMRLMRNFGFSGYDTVVHPGTNGKMTEVCAAMGLANFEALDKFVEVNRRNYLSYVEAFTNICGLSVLEFDEDEHNNFQYVVLLVADDCPVSRDDLISTLQAENVLARRYFWPGVHQMQPYRSLFPDADRTLPNTRRVADAVIVLPTGLAVSPESIDRIAGIVGQRVNPS